MRPSARIRSECVLLPLRILHRRLGALYDDALRPLGMTGAQLNILVAIDQIEAAGGTPTAATVCRALCLEKSTASRDLAGLVAARWVQRRPGADGRSQALHIAAAGQHLLQAALPAWERAQTEALALLGKGARGVLAQAAGRAVAPALASGAH